MKDYLRAIIAGFVTGALLLIVVPYWLIKLNAYLSFPYHISAVTTIIGVLLVVLACLWWWYCTFWLSSLGKGTPAPVAPTKRLVIKGPYTWSRNPMYICYQVIFWGIALFFGHLLLFAYAIVMCLFINWYVCCVEEPRMRKKFGQEYFSYCTCVRRWLGKKPTADLR